MGGRSTRGARPRLGLLVPLKVFQQLQLFRRRNAAVPTLLDGGPYYGSDANAIATRATHTASLTTDQIVNIINATIDELIAPDIGLPASSALDRLAEQIHARALARLFKQVTRRLTDEQRLALDRLLAQLVESAYPAVRANVSILQ